MNNGPIDIEDGDLLSWFAAVTQLAHQEHKARAAAAARHGKVELQVAELKLSTRYCQTAAATIRCIIDRMPSP